MKIVEIETGKKVNMEEEDLYIQDNEVYKIRLIDGYEYNEYGEEERIYGWDSINVALQYRIESDVRSREEIEEEMEILQKSIEENQWDDYFSTQECAKLEALEWVLKGLYN